MARTKKSASKPRAKTTGKRKSRSAKSTSPRKTKVVKKAVKPKKNTKRFAAIRSMFSSKSKDVVALDLKQFYVPLAIVIAGLMISCSIILAFSDGSISLFSSEELECSATDPLSKDCLKQAAKDADLKYSKFKTCLNEDTYNQAIEDAIATAQDIGLQGTPHVVIAQRKDDVLKGFYAGGAQDFDYYKDLIEKVKEKGIEAVQQENLKENVGTLEDLTAKYKEAYAQQGQGYSQEELDQWAELSAQAKYDSYQLKEFNTDYGAKIGKDDAGIVLIEYSDFNCSYCKKFAQDTLPEIKSQYVDNGEVMIVFKPMPLEQTPAEGYSAANAALCAADQDKFLEYHNILFEVDKKED